MRSTRSNTARVCLRSQSYCRINGADTCLPLEPIESGARRLERGWTLLTEIAKESSSRPCANPSPIALCLQDKVDELNGSIVFEVPCSFVHLGSPSLHTQYVHTCGYIYIYTHTPPCRLSVRASYGRAPCGSTLQSTAHLQRELLAWPHNRKCCTCQSNMLSDSPDEQQAAHTVTARDVRN